MLTWPKSRGDIFVFQSQKRKCWEEIRNINFSRNSTFAENFWSILRLVGGQIVNWLPPGWKGQLKLCKVDLISWRSVNTIHSGADSKHIKHFYTKYKSKFESRNQLRQIYISESMYCEKLFVKLTNLFVILGAQTTPVQTDRPPSF